MHSLIYHHCWCSFIRKYRTSTENRQDKTTTQNMYVRSTLIIKQCVLYVNIVLCVSYTFNYRVSEWHLPKVHLSAPCEPTMRLTRDVCVCFVVVSDGLWIRWLIETALCCSAEVLSRDTHNNFVGASSRSRPHLLTQSHFW